MIRIIQLLNEKNHFLEKFFSLNEQQIHKLERGEFNELENFYQKREEILKILKYVDQQIDLTHQKFAMMNKSYEPEYKPVVASALKAKDIYVKKILEQDLLVLCLVDDLKNKMLDELRDVKKAQKAMAGYGSNQMV